MMSLKTVRCITGIFLSCILAGTLAASHANAATILGIYLDPPTTAGAGATSTRSGHGSFQLYAADDNAGTFGIATYSITFGPAVTASSNRSPVTTIQDSNGDSQSAGFNLLRSSSNANPMTGAQNLPGQTPYLIKGMGQTAGSFGATCQALGCPVIGPATSGSWGGPYVGGTLVDWNSGNGAKKWVLLGEGLYNPTLLGPTLQSALAAIVPSATMTAYSGGFDAQMVFNTIIVFVPEPASTTMAALSLFGLLGLARCRCSSPNIM